MQIPDYLTPTDDGVVVHAFVQPRAARTGLAGVHGDALRIKISAPPVDGRANEALCDFLAGLLHVARSRVSVTSGASSRHKRVRVAGITAEAAARAMQSGS
jgi:uncharacterized protein